MRSYTAETLAETLLCDRHFLLVCCCERRAGVEDLPGTHTHKHVFIYICSSIYSTSAYRRPVPVALAPQADRRVLFYCRRLCSRLLRAAEEKTSHLLQVLDLVHLRGLLGSFLLLTSSVSLVSAAARKKQKQGVILSDLLVQLMSFARDITRRANTSIHPHVERLSIAEVGIPGRVDGPHVQDVLTRAGTPPPSVEERHVEGAATVCPGGHLFSSTIRVSKVVVGAMK